MKRAAWCLLFGLLFCCSESQQPTRCVNDIDCPSGQRCIGGECTTHDPCQNVTCESWQVCVQGKCVDKDCDPPCNSPPGDLACYDLPAPCVKGQCQYQPVDGRPCDDAEACTTEDTCDAEGVCSGRPMVCQTPPADYCLDGSTLRRYQSEGSCQQGECIYAYEDYHCPNGCQDGACVGCQPSWVDVTPCDCTPGPCSGCSGHKTQSDGCGAERQVSCTLQATGCPAGQVCYQDSCCQPDCAGRECGPDGCGGSCGSCPGLQQCQNGSCTGCAESCTAAEACIMESCAPLAILLGSEDQTPSGWCPPGYQLAGRWRTGPYAFDNLIEGVDFNYLNLDAAWMWLCSADPNRVKAVATVNDCGSVSPSCSGAIRGSWHVGSDCATLSAVDADGNQLQAGWLGLCVSSGTEVFAEIAHNDCGPAGPGCAGSRLLGAWHTSPAICGVGMTGVGASGNSFDTGWMNLCLNSANFPPVDRSSLTGKVLAGYQGWFAAPGDGSDWNSWIHWFRSQTPTADNATFDLWPDLSEYEVDELFPTQMTYRDGQPVKLYSAYREKTVRRHFRWMAEYGIDGVFLQRFLHEAVLPVPGAFRDQVARNVMAGAEAYGRVFAIEYDISGSTDDMLPGALIDDWKHLVDDLKLTSSPRYLYHRGRPLVGIWGIGFSDRAGTPAHIATLVNFFHNAPEERYRATVMGGVPEGWRTSTGSSKPGFADAYRLYDVINPWSVGRYGDDAGVVNFKNNYILPDLAECHTLGKDYLPVLFPGFSWANLTGDSNTFNLIPRRGGLFYWKQFYEFLGAGCNMLFLAMFDEVDEGTAIMKAASSQDQLPAQGRFLALDQDGISVPADWYLRLAGAGGKTLSGQIAPRAQMPTR